jgi:hypothetical protein
MSYSTGHLISQDQDLRNRAAIAAAEQGVTAGEEEHWVFLHARQLAIQPGWREAWESALANGVEHPGADPADEQQRQVADPRAGALIHAASF